MRSLKVLLLFAFFTVFATAAISGCAAEGNITALDTYVQAADSSYQWKKVSSANNATVLDLTSQTWHGTKWQHRLTVVQPTNAEFPHTALLLIGFGENAIEAQSLHMLAEGTGCTVVGISSIPNQPLWDRKEDALIAYTFQQYLQTGDATWPLLLPMTKSVVKAMDAVEEYTKSTSTPITKFIVGGASKRGWTTWLAGAEDKRVIGIVPMVYDNLNMPAQLPHQKEMLGEYSSQIGDYTALNLPAKISTPAGEELVDIVDPYTYRDRLTMPKLIVNATNDPYWTVDSLNLYYNDLPGAKNVFYIPNAGHSMNLEKGISGALYLMSTIGNWARIVAAGKTPPAVTLNVTDTSAGKKFIAAATDATIGVLWVAKSPTKDFRKSTWAPVTMTNVNGYFEGEIATPKSGYIAVFADVTLPGTAAMPMRLSTPMTWWSAS